MSFAYIFSHSGVGGYALRLVGKGQSTNCKIQFVKIGTSEVFDTGVSPEEEGLEFVN